LYKRNNQLVKVGLNTRANEQLICHKESLPFKNIIISNVAFDGNKFLCFEQYKIIDKVKC